MYYTLKDKKKPMHMPKTRWLDLFENIYRDGIKCQSPYKKSEFSVFILLFVVLSFIYSFNM
jgi:hypothetical protein